MIKISILTKYILSDTNGHISGRIASYYTPPSISRAVLAISIAFPHEFLFIIEIISVLSLKNTIVKQEVRATQFQGDFPYTMWNDQRITDYPSAPQRTEAV